MINSDSRTKQIQDQDKESLSPSKTIQDVLSLIRKRLAPNCLRGWEDDDRGNKKRWSNSIPPQVQKQAEAEVEVQRQTARVLDQKIMESQILMWSINDPPIT